MNWATSKQSIQLEGRMRGFLGSLPVKTSYSSSLLSVHTIPNPGKLDLAATLPLLLHSHLSVYCPQSTLSSSLSSLVSNLRLRYQSKDTCTSKCTNRNNAITMKFSSVSNTNASLCVGRQGCRSRQRLVQRSWKWS